MKIKSEKFLSHIKNNSDSYKLILFYGPNFGLVDVLYNNAIEALSINKDDPFTVSKIDGNDFKENPLLLYDNISTFGMMSDKRTVLLNLVPVTINKTIENIIIDALKEAYDFEIIIKANNLGSQNSLVKYIENLKNGLLIPCYEENINNNKVEISKLLNKYDLVFSDDFISSLNSKFSNDSLTNKMELEKLENFLINNNDVTESMLYSLITDNVDVNINKIINFCVSGNPQEALIYLDKIYDKSNTSIILTKSFIKHFKLMEKILLYIENGMNLTDAVNNIKPPIFFKDKPLITFQCKLWSLRKINIIFRRLIDIELKFKSNIYPEQTLLAQFVLSTSVIAKNAIKT
mgnify:FL=1